MDLLGVALPALTARLLAKLFDGVCQDMGASGSKELRRQLSDLAPKAKLRAISSNWVGYRKVKTILNMDSPTDIGTVFVPPGLLLHRKKVPALEIADRHGQQLIVFQGVAGQGKSFLMRYLASRDLVRGNRIPLLVELRRASEQATLSELLTEEASKLGLGLSSGLLNELAGAGKVAAYFDGLDEVPPSQLKSTLYQLEELHRTISGLTVYVSTRPETGARSLREYTCYDLQPLEHKDVESIISKVCTEADTAQKILASISQSHALRHQLLTTPLMVCLLILKFRLDQSVPENESEFFTNLFDLLLDRHDKTKTGFTRERASEAPDAYLRSAFERFCYVTKKHGVLNGANEVMTGHMRTSVAELSPPREAAPVLQDIVDITCLLVRDGGEIRFLHRTIQEFFAAQFISHLQENNKLLFYKSVARDVRPWLMELRFLQQLDRVAYFKHLLIRLYQSVFSKKRASEVSDADTTVLADALLADMQLDLPPRQGSSRDDQRADASTRSRVKFDILIGSGNSVIQDTQSLAMPSLFTGSPLFNFEMTIKAALEVASSDTPPQTEKRARDRAIPEIVRYFIHRIPGDADQLERLYTIVPISLKELAARSESHGKDLKRAAEQQARRILDGFASACAFVDQHESGERKFLDLP